MKNPYNQLVLVEFGKFNHSAAFIYKIVSDKPITDDIVTQYFIDTEEFDDETDCITLFDFDEITEVKL